MEAFVFKDIYFLKKYFHRMSKKFKRISTIKCVFGKNEFNEILNYHIKLLKFVFASNRLIMSFGFKIATSI